MSCRTCLFLLVESWQMGVKFWEGFFGGEDFGAKFLCRLFLFIHLCSLVTFLQTNMDAVSMFCLGHNSHKCHISHLYLVGGFSPTHLKHMLVKLVHFARDPGEKSSIFELPLPPPRYLYPICQVQVSGESVFFGGVNFQGKQVNCFSLVFCRNKQQLALAENGWLED